MLKSNLTTQRKDNLTEYWNASKKVFSWKSNVLLIFLFINMVACEPKSPETIQKATGPNILFIFTDDQSQRTAGCYPDENAWDWVQTPNIDQLAQDGVRFSNAYGASWCAPSRACVLSGLLPHAIPGMKLYENRDRDRTWACIGDGYDPSITPFWPSELRKAGYETAMIGKWHVGQNPGHGVLWDYSVVWDQNVATGSDWYNNQELSINGADYKVVPGYSTDVYTGLATDYIKEDHEKPWLLWLCYNAPHIPITSHPRHDNLYTDVDITLPTDIFGPRPDKPEYMYEWTMLTKASNGTVYYNSNPLKEVIKGYNRLVSPIDDGIAELLSALEESGQLDNTLVIFTSDQGYAWGEHGYAWKTGPYDACLRMPLIFSMPGTIASGAVCSQPVTILDVIPTIWNMTGLQKPWKMHGNDLTSLLMNPQASYDEPILMEHFGSKFGTETDQSLTQYYGTGVPNWLFLRNGKYKYIRTLLYNEIEELYDLETDPEELVNLALDPAYNDLLKEFRILLKEELENTDAGFSNSLPAPRTL